MGSRLPLDYGSLRRHNLSEKMTHFSKINYSINKDTGKKKNNTPELHAKITYKNRMTTKLDYF